MDSMRCTLVLFAVAIVPFLLLAQQIEFSAGSPERRVFLTVYSVGNSVKLPFGGGPGIQPWYSRLWVDGRKITFIRRGQFLTLRLPEGDHSLAGETAWGHQGDAKTVISIHGEQRSFVRLTSKSNGLPYAPVHHFAEQVTCREGI